MITTVFKCSFYPIIKDYFIKKSCEYFFLELKSKVKNFIKEIDQEQSQKISIIALSIIGLVASTLKKQIDLALFFISIIILEKKNYFYFKDHKEDKLKIKELENKSLNDEKTISILQESITELKIVNSIIPKLEEKLNLFEETHKDVNRAIDLLIEVKEENRDLKNLLSQDAHKIAIHSEKIEQSSQKIEKFAEQMTLIAINNNLENEKNFKS